MKEGSRWKSYCKVGRSRRQKYAENPGFVNNKPDSSDMFASAYQEGALNRLHIECISNFQVDAREIERIIDPSPYDGPFADIDEAFETSKACNRILIDEYIIPEDECKAIAIAIINGTARAISDGSFKPDVKKGSSAFITTPGKTIVNRLVGKNWVPGGINDQSAYRSELSGLSGILSSFAIIVEIYNITEGSIEIACDSQGVLNEVDSNDVCLYCEQTSFDILQDIHHRIKLLPIEIKCRWVEVHQFKRHGISTWWSRQNARVDIFAKNFLFKCICRNKQYTFVQLWYEKWSLVLDGEKQ